MEAAHRLYAPDAGAQMAKMFGVPEAYRKSFEAPPIEVWKCNWQTVQLFSAMGTQWRVSMGGPTGLDYTALPTVAALRNIRLTSERFLGIRVMENEALKVMSESRKKW